jgi:ABC-type multidrug transport system ATPase subunit
MQRLKPRTRGSIAAIDLSKSFGDRNVVQGLSLEAGPGSVIALVGPNGCGKTTVLRMLAGTLDPDQGDVQVCGGPPGRGASALAPAGDRCLYWRLDGRRNLAFYGRVNGTRPLDDAIESVIVDMDLRGFVDRRVGAMSTGQRRRLVVASALVSRAPLLLIDEPFADLDAKGIESVATLVSAWASEGGCVAFAAPATTDGPPADVVLQLGGEG